MKKILVTLLKVVVCTCFILQTPFYTPTKVSAADYSANVVISDFEMYNATGPITSTNPMAHIEMAGIVMELDITLSGITFVEGDTASFDYFTFPGADTGMNNTVSTTDWADIVATMGGTPNVVIGQWRVYIDGSTRKVEMIFNSNVDGYSSLEDIVLDTGLINYIGYAHINQLAEKRVTLGAVTKDVWCKSSVAAPLNPSYVTKGSTSANNTVIGWDSHVNNIGIANSHSAIAGYTYPTSVYFEDNLGPNELDSLLILGLTYVPAADLSAPLAVTSYCPDLSGKFTELVQTAAHTTYADFKSALAVNEWGVYFDGTDRILVINFGDLNGSASGLYWATEYSGFAASAADTAISRRAFTTADRTALIAYYNSIHGSTNAVSGQIISFIVRFGVKYQPVTTTVPVSNIAKVLYNNGSEATRTATGNLVGLFGSAKAAKYEAILYKTDTSVGGTVLPGATIELQRWNDSTGWGAVGSKVTDVNGMVSFPGLSPGKYRFVETIAAPGYDVNSVEFYDTAGNLLTNSEFEIIDTDTEGHIIKAANTKLITSITTSKASLDEGRDGYIDADEDVTYTITVTNTGTATNDITVQDALVDILPYVDNPGPNSLTISSNMNPPITTYTVQDLMSGIAITIDVGETLTFTFMVHTIDTLSKNMVDVFDNVAVIKDEDNNTYRPRTVDPLRAPTTTPDVPDTGVMDDTYSYVVVTLVSLLGVFMLINKRTNRYGLNSK